MDFNLRISSLNKTKNYIKLNTFFFLLSGKNTNSKDGLPLEQTLKSTNFIAHRIINRDSRKIILKTIFINLEYTITSTVFFSKSKTKNQFLVKEDIFDKFESAFFILLIIKLNWKLYSPIRLKKMSFLTYLTNHLLFFHLLSSSRKLYLIKYRKFIK